ncbi:alpha-D-xyloside xylohydrolase [Geodermatophilus pulveris]|uniref:Alpha-D-xyloside xylohydrolase n=1 Tax=Geodermatophilus pulveris TaxID=1564159 RepID=A0A239C2H5_9ACTN|nr:TIM-barrel domain-containing protein [Geodermatophilus pulveris]SNS13614.1 alpha-D-xyloside xylohydrolase [Geodermatophilus pulveris]
MPIHRLLGSPSFRVSEEEAAATGVRVTPVPGRAGCAVLSRDDGREHHLSLTVPTAGVLHLRVDGHGGAVRHTAAVTDGIDEPPIEFRAAPDGLTFASWGYEGFWSADGAQFAWGSLSASVLPWRHHAPGLAPAPRGWGELIPRWTTHAHLPPGASVFGGGASAQGPGLRGRTRECVNTNTSGVAGVDAAYLNVPLFWSTTGWGLYIDTGSPVIADLGDRHSEIAALTTYDTELDLFVLSGSPAEMLAQYARLTGLPVQPPGWALGVWTSRDSYFSASEVAAVLDRYEAEDCPVDVVHVDAWQEGNLFLEQSSNWQPDRARWPSGWHRRLERSDVHLSLWTNPLLRPDTPAGVDAVRRNIVLRAVDGRPAQLPDGSSRLVLDFSAPGAAAWWEDKIALLLTEGAEVVKADFGEDVPLDARLHDGAAGWQVRNSYSRDYQAATHAALRARAVDHPAAVFCRSGTAGSQRFAFHWVGDTPSSWMGMTTALRACLSMSLSGCAFVGSDVGGFWAPGSMGRCARAFASFDPTLLEADVDPELYVRWAQWGALSPLMRFHGTGRREPWAYPQPYGDIAVDACRLRRRLVPHLVRSARQAAVGGPPVMRPMVLAFPDERDARQADLQYLLGDRLLVAPILVPGGHVDVWVPSGRWWPLVPDVGAVELIGPGWRSLELPLSAVPAWILVPPDHGGGSADETRSRFFEAADPDPG